MTRRAAKAILIVIGLAVATILVHARSEAQPVQTEICLTNGQKIGVERFEIRDGKFLLYITGSLAPMEFAASTIKGVNIPCQATTAPQLATSPQGATAGQSRFGIHGSNTIGEQLMPLLVETYELSKSAIKPKVALGLPEEQSISLNSGVVIDLKAHGSGTAMKSLLEGNAVIGMSSRRANDDEAKAIQSKFNLNIRGSGNEHVLALDGLAVIVNPANPIRQLTLFQIAQVFAGQIANWSGVGGVDAPIRVHRRDEKSGTFDTFNSVVLSPQKLKMSPAALAHESSEVLSDEVSRDVHAIGFIGLPYINRSRALSVGETCGISSHPTKFAIKSEIYPLSRRLFLYSLGRPGLPTAAELLDFALSDAAQQKIQEVGFVDQLVDFQDTAEQQNWTQAFTTAPGQFLPAGTQVPVDQAGVFASASSRTQRSSITLRFERSSADLDTRAQQDVARLVRYLRSPAASGRQIWLAGFADAEGSWANNLSLAARRATAAAQALQKAGIQVPGNHILSFSYMAPVACNDTDAGRAKNRRVEIWFSS